MTDWTDLKEIWAEEERYQNIKQRLLEEVVAEQPGNVQKWEVGNKSYDYQRPNIYLPLADKQNPDTRRI